MYEMATILSDNTGIQQDVTSIRGLARVVGGLLFRTHNNEMIICMPHNLHP